MATVEEFLFFQPTSVLTPASAVLHAITQAKAYKLNSTIYNISYKR